MSRDSIRARLTGRRPSPRVVAPVNDVSRETVAVATAPHPLIPAERLQLLADAWHAQTRAAGPADETMLYAGRSLPPVPAPRQEEPVSLPSTPAGGGGDDPVSPPPAATATRVTDWHSRHDPRSRAYDVAPLVAVPAPTVDVVLDHGPILDQGTTPPLSVHDASGCAGFALAAVVNVHRAMTRPVYGKLEDVEFLGAEDARAFYAWAQDNDAVSGHAYPGTSVLAVMQAGVHFGHFDAYRWAFGTRPILQAILQNMPVLVGVQWTPSCETPDGDGVITPGPGPVSGHCLALIGVRRRIGDRSGPFFLAQQSRGPAVGRSGIVAIHHRDLSAMLAGVGEAAVAVPRYGAPVIDR